MESYALFLATLLLIDGSLGDLYGRRKIFAAGVVLFSLASAWCGLAPNIRQLIVARGLQGIGGALLVPGSLALISANFPEKERGRAIGTWSGFTSITAAIGPVLGGWFVEHGSGRLVFFINIPLGMTVLWLTLWKVPESAVAVTDINDAEAPRSSFRMEPCLLLVAPYRWECGCQSDALVEDTAHARPKSVSRCERFSDLRLLPRLDKVIPSDWRLLDDNVREITAAIDRTACWSDVETDIEAMGLAVREALANAIVHGSHCDPEKTVRIFVAVNENCDLFVSVKDSGSGFDPSGLPNPTAVENLLAPHGRGIFLIRQLMDEVDFVFHHGTEIRMLRRQNSLE